ncbi:VTT domain-containing protein [Pelagicoccus sp. SDUM812002]|uniref:TVP38/TMEM64 family protein n=1 Tax=Pelagicoccus sp. SDUM812002 TaxID=3041266 RepID=UPI00280EA4FB|nr:VTT domain-containing protein [Pelagicoccus sp. SDUM812002]MDQ8186357.1 VTT domain-containing protein [Pelagicoccus sp. SDUM812002]
MEAEADPVEKSWKWLQIAVVGLVFAIGFWQFARVGFDWRAVLEASSLWMFFVAMATLPVFGFPISACYIYAGVAFEPLEASLACIGALAVNMSVSYALTHSVFKKPITAFLAKRTWSIPEMSDYSQFRFTFLVRTVPGPPFFFQNLILGLAGIPFWTYLWISLLGQGGIAIGVIICSRYLSHDPWSKGGITVMVILVALFVAKSVRAIRQRREKRRSSIEE